ncbi:hypothetical protein [Mesorhizobium sp. 8]|uniref:hypothetical protein n=1 Tax=Mesorhizobium sp. 8 TaxID=2584466 RepID=UPI001122EFEF|nr:hypothetical protein [Mesorhizobium sp. 8]QDC00373.1 hypothetical protein FGU64_08055 [Mesorhizobium sp. 8]
MTVRVLGKTQVAILRSTVGRWFLTTTEGQQNSALRLHDRGLLDRDPKNSRRFTATTAGRDAIYEHDDEIARRGRSYR